DCDATAVPDALQFGDLSETNQRGRHLLAALHVREQVGAAADEHRTLGCDQQIGSLCHGSWRQVSEIGKAQHCLLSRGAPPPLADATAYNAWWRCMPARHPSAAAALGAPAWPQALFTFSRRAFLSAWGPPPCVRLRPDTMSVTFVRRPAPVFVWRIN